MGQPVDEIRDSRARPWPLADSLEAFFVDIDDNNRPFGRFARVQHLEKIENANAKLLNRQRIGEAQGGEGNEQYEGEATRQSEMSRPAQKPFHLRSPAGGRSDEPVIFPGRSA